MGRRVLGFSVGLSLLLILVGCSPAVTGPTSTSTTGSPQSGAIAPRSVPTEAPTAVAASPVAPPPTTVPAPAAPTPIPPKTDAKGGARKSPGLASIINMPALIVRGPRSSHKVALTFDMGSVGGSTLDVLATLRANGVHATFFVTGKWAEQNPELLRAIVAGGHEVANHSYSHPDFTKLDDKAIEDQLDKTESVVEGIAGVSTRPYWRPPFGAYNARVLCTVRNHGYEPVYWTVDGRDWRNDSTVGSVISRDVRQADGGGIILMHGALDKTDKALPSILEQLHARGLEPAPLSEVLQDK